jgi:hypothetical protein
VVGVADIRRASALACRVIASLFAIDARIVHPWREPVDDLYHQKDPGSQPSTMRLGRAFTNVEKDPLQNGVFTAINMDTGGIAWQHKGKHPLIGGALATGVNLVLMGEGDGYLDAFDAAGGSNL